MSQALVDRGVHTFAMRSGLSEDDFGWGSASFHKMVGQFYKRSRADMLRHTDATLLDLHMEAL